MKNILIITDVCSLAISAYTNAGSPFGRSYNPSTGITTNGRVNADGSTTIIRGDRTGRVISRIRQSK